MVRHSCVIVLSTIIAIFCIHSSFVSAACLDGNCETCSAYGDDVCDACKARFGIIEGQTNCGACSVGCINSCNTWYAGKCDPCLSSCSYPCNISYWYDPTAHVCSACDVNCVGGCRTNGKGKCDGSCKAGTTFIGANCIQCDPNCASGCSLQLSLKCDSLCNAGWALSAYKCVKCDTKCKNATGCTKYGAGKCDVECVAGYSVFNSTGSSGQTCVLCDTNCTSGCAQTGAGKCDSACRTGWALSSSFVCVASTNGNWSAWSGSTCTTPGDTTTRRRNCTNPAPSGLGLQCETTNGSRALTETTQCPCDPRCNVTTGCVSKGASRCDTYCVGNYAVSQSDFTCQPCDPQCSSGCQMQGVGKCDSSCKFGFGLEIGNYTCMPTVNGSWSSWTTLDPCSSKGQLNETAVRYCNNPPPSYGGTLCVDRNGLPADVERNVTDCACDQYCTSGCRLTGYRSCDSQCIAGYGLETGNYTCMKSIDGGWSGWTEVVPCTSLGQLTNKLQRLCNNPTPMYGGSLCTNSTGGLSVEEYNSTLCPCDQHCTTAGCSNYGYLQCNGPCDATYGLETGNNTCMKSVNGGWSQWTTTEDCTTPGQLTPKREVRYCNNPTPMYGGAQCLNSSNQEASEEWNVTACPCDLRCLSGCTTHGYQKCDGTCDSTSGINTTTHDCRDKVDGVWSAWAITTACSSVAASQVRTRYCNNPAPQYGGQPCYNSTNNAADTETETTVCPTTVAAPPTTTVPGGGNGQTTTVPGGGPGGNGQTTTVPGGGSGQTTVSNVGCAARCTSGCASKGLGKCDSACENKYGLNKTSYTCGPCMAACLGPCNTRGPGTCDGPCTFGLGVTSTKLCAACSKDCTAGCAVTGAGKCDSCPTGYALRTSDNTCQPCDTRCTSGCTTPNTCSSSCMAGYVLNNTRCLACDPNCAKVVGSCNVRGPSKCDSTCGTLFALTAQYTCGACATQCNTKCTVEGPPYCDVCTTANCNSCKPGYVLKALTVNGVTKHSCY